MQYHTNSIGLTIAGSRSRQRLALHTYHCYCRLTRRGTAIAQFESAKLCKALPYTAIKSHADEACQLLRVEGIHWQLTGRTISEIQLSALIVCQRWYLSTVLLLDGVDGVARVCIQL